MTSTIGLVAGLGERARRHRDLAGQFRKLEADIIRTGDDQFSEQQVADWHARIIEIEANEPAALYALTQLCERELFVARGEAQRAPHVGWLRWLFAHYWIFAPK